MRIEINEYIVADSEICHGKPTFKGTRIMEQGADTEEIFAGFPSLTNEHIKAALHFAVELTRGKENVITGIQS